MPTTASETSILFDPLLCFTIAAAKFVGVVGTGSLRGNLFSTLSSILFSQVVVPIGSALFLPSCLMTVLFVHIMYIFA